MLSSAYDPNQTSLVVMLSGEVQDAEWQALYEHSLRMLEDCSQASRPFVLVLLSAPDTSRPNANWRRKLAELRNKNERVPRVLTAIVTSSILLRGVITAMNWIVPPKEKERLVAYHTFDEAVSWLHKETNRSMEHLFDLYDTCRNKRVA